MTARKEVNKGEKKMKGKKEKIERVKEECVKLHKRDLLYSVEPQSDNAPEKVGGN